LSSKNAWSSQTFLDSQPLVQEKMLHQPVEDTMGDEGKKSQQHLEKPATNQTRLTLVISVR
jgi:hypothetical protein